MKLDHALRMVTGSEDTFEGWLVNFDGGLAGGKDLYNTRFTKDTRYHLDWFSERPLLYHHGQDQQIQTDPVGKILSLELRDAGVWMQAQLDKGSSFYSDILSMVKRGALALSSGTIDYLMKMDQRSGDILEWPIIEGSLTPTPGGLNNRVDVSTVRTAFRSAGLDEASLARLDELIALYGDDGALTRSASPSDEHPETAASNDDPSTTSTPDGGEDAKRAAATIPGETSFEEIRDQIEYAINNGAPWMELDYWYVVQTYPDHVIVCCCDWDGDDPDVYWDIPYTIEDSGLTLGEPTQVEKTWTPVTRSLELPLTLDAQALVRTASAFCQRTKDLAGRRTAEHRGLSRSNQTALGASADALTETATALRSMSTAVMDDATAQTEVELYADPEARAADIELFELTLALSPTQE